LPGCAGGDGNPAAQYFSSCASRNLRRVFPINYEFTNGFSAVAQALICGKSLMKGSLMLRSMPMADEVTLKVVRGVAEVKREQWDALVAGATPFMKWDWLDSLERCGCVNEQTGWLPHHIVVERAAKVVAACPMYLKLHSMGEFVFDYEWAEAAHRAGIQYYPKMLVGIHFPPVTGHRFVSGAG